MEISMSTSTMPTAAATASSSNVNGTSMGGMSMGGGGMSSGNTCKISMLWNWYTVDACFISSTWQITSPGMFAGSCIGVILLVMSLGALRRMHRAYDVHIAKSRRPEPEQAPTPAREGSDSGASGKLLASARVRAFGGRTSNRPSVVQQAVRALLHTAQFAVAYFVMLLAMYYNGYIIICILIGAFLGYFVFEWEFFNMFVSAAVKLLLTNFCSASGYSSAAGATEVTGCCG